MVRALPIGVQDFKEVRDSDYLYVDKSDMISQILSEGTEELCSVIRPPTSEP